jgi:phage shock protein E
MNMIHKKFVTAFWLALCLIFSIPLHAQETVLIDVRTADEFNQGHIENALHMPYQDIVTRVEQANIAHSTPIELYCRSGRRADVARQSLEAAGYTNVTNLGGYEAILANKASACEAETC